MKTLILAIFMSLFIVAFSPSTKAAAMPPILDAQPVSACGSIRLSITPNGDDEIVGVYRAVFNHKDEYPVDADFVDTGNTSTTRFDNFKPITTPHFVWYKVVTTGGASYSGQVATYVCDFSTPTPSPESSSTPEVSATPTPSVTPTAEATSTPEPTTAPTKPEKSVKDPKETVGGLAKTGV